MANHDIINLVKQAISEIEPNADVILYGSRARGTSDGDSDWDFLILTDIHIRYQGYNASVAIEDGEVLAGEMPTRQLRMVQVWMDLHREELLADWELAKEGIEPFRIDPLK